MATCNWTGGGKPRIILHGNEGFESSQLLELIVPSHKKNEVCETESFEFFPFLDLSTNRKIPLFRSNHDMSMLIEHSDQQGIEISAILVLISQTEIFREGMHALIRKLPSNGFYGFDEANEKEWWSRVIVVFFFETDDKINDIQVTKSIDENRGIRDIVKRVGDRCFWVSKQTTPEVLTERINYKMSRVKRKLIVGGSHSDWYEEMMQSFQKTLKSCPLQTKEKDLYQRFVLVGGRKSGKSTLGNLLMGPRDAPLFGTDWYYKLSGKGKMFQLGEVDIDSRWVPWSEHKRSKLLKIQILDEPVNLKPKQYGESLGKCVNEFQKTTFLITVNLNSKSPLSNEDFTKIIEISKAFSNYNLDFFSNSIIVLTQMDEVIDNKQETHQILNKLLQNDNYSFVKKLMRLVNGKYFPVNGMDFGSKNRCETIKWISKIILDKMDNQPKSVNSSQEEISTNIVCNGTIPGNKKANSNMTQKCQINVPAIPERYTVVDRSIPAEQRYVKREERKQSSCKGDAAKDEIIDRKVRESQIEVKKEESTKFPALKGYQAMANLIHKSLNCIQDENKELHHLFSSNNIEIEMREVLKELSRMGSTKARVVVINFEEMQTEEIYLKLSYLSKNSNFKNCTLIAFKIQCEIEKSINEKIPKRLDCLVEAANSRYIFLTEPNRNSEKKQKLPSDQQLQKSIYSANSKEDTNEELGLKEKLDKKETSECNQTLDSKVFLSHNIVFSSNEPNKLLFSYFLLDKIADHEDITGDSGPQ